MANMMTPSHLHNYFVTVSKQAHCVPTEDPDTFQAFLLLHFISWRDVFFHVTHIWGEGPRRIWESVVGADHSLMKVLPFFLHRHFDSPLSWYL